MQSLLAAANSPSSFNTFAKAPTASHNAGITLALCALLAALIATLKPLSGCPAFANSVAFSVSMCMRQYISAFSALRLTASSSMALKARGKEPFRMK